MRIISCVPSWTETLLVAGASVVGRTKYCIHPADQVADIAVVGGTKHIDWQKVSALAPDLVIFDREENNKEMANNCPYPWLATHVRSIEDMPREIESLATKLALPQLHEMAERWRRVVSAPRPRFQVTHPPALLEWKTLPPSQGANAHYVIWAHPWMTAGPDTFIGSVLAFFGWTAVGAESDENQYPKFDPKKKGPDTIFLCSTEPYPFAKRPEVLAELPGHVALVDGEKMSWFGVRSLEYLESV